MFGLTGPDPCQCTILKALHVPDRSMACPGAPAGILDMFGSIALCAIILLEEVRRSLARQAARRSDRLLAAGATGCPNR